MSERFRFEVRQGRVSTDNLQHAIHFVNSMDDQAEEVNSLLQRMMEIAAAASQDSHMNVDREAYQLEFETLQKEITSLARHSRFASHQSIGRDVLASYDGSTEHFKFWQETGKGGRQIEKSFSATAVDAEQNLINFDSSEDYTLSRDGKRLFYFSHVTGDAGGTVRLHAYDIAANRVTTGSDLFASEDKLFTADTGQLYTNGNGTLYTIAADNLSRTATVVTDLEAGTEFSVFKGDAYYFRTTDNHIVQRDITLGTATSLLGPTTFGAGDHSFAASGKYAAEESVAGSIRVIDTRTGSESTLAIGGANDVVGMHFSESGDRIYYVNQNNYSIDYIDVATDSSGNVNLTYGGSVVQGTTSSSFQGIDLGGANPSSNQTFVLAGSEVQDIEYHAVDMSLYALGLSNTRVDSFASANTAIADILEAQNRASAARADIRATASRFSFIMSGHRKHVANLAAAESSIRDVDMALESTRLANQQVQFQAAQAVLAQFNLLSKNVLQLLQQ
jgi:flagellin